MLIKPHTALAFILTLALLAAGLTFADDTPAPAAQPEAAEGARVEPPAMKPIQPLPKGGSPAFAARLRAIAQAAAPSNEQPAAAQPDAQADAPPAEAQPDAQPDPPSPERIQKLVSQLGDDSFQIREAAEAKLIEIGLPAWDMVEEAQRSDDPEVAMRAQRVMKRLHELKALLRINAIRKNMLWKTPLDAAPVTSLSRHGNVMLIGQLGKGITAINLATGKRVWQKDAEDVDKTHPAVAAGRVFDNTSEGIRALDLATGEEAWTAKLERLTTPPAVDGGLVFVSTGNYVTGNPSRAMRAIQLQLRNGNAQQRAALLKKMRDQSSEVHAYDAKTGELKWKASFDDSVSGAPVAGHGVVVAAKMNGGAVVLDAETGKVRATINTNGAASGVTLSKDRAILQAGGQVLAVNLADGKTIWDQKLNDAAAAGIRAPRNGIVVINGRVVRGGVGGDSAPIIRGDRVYVTTPTMGDSDEPIVALDLYSGAKVWSARPKSMRPDDDAKQQANGNQAGGVVIRGGNGGVIQGRVIINGRVMNPSGVAANAFTGPAESGGALYVGGEDGLYAFDAKTGTQLWHFVTDHGVSAPPIVHRGVVYFAAAGQAGNANNNAALRAAVIRQLQAQNGGNPGQKPQQIQEESDAGLYAVKIVESASDDDAEATE